MVFVDAHQSVGAWASRSLELLSAWDIPDFSTDVWTIKTYGKHVRGLLADFAGEAMAASRRCQKSPCPHLLFGGGFSGLHVACCCKAFGLGVEMLTRFQVLV